MDNSNVRKAVLDKADEAVNGDRNADYGDPTQDFDRTARYWNEHLCALLERKMHKHPDLLEATLDYAVDLVRPEDVAIMMVMLKASRLSWDPAKEDSWVDIAGYAACGAQCADQSYKYQGGLK